MTKRRTTLCGFHAVETGLRSDPVRIAEIVHDRSRKDQRISRLLTLARSRGVRVVRRDASMLDSLAGKVRHQGIVGLLSKAPTLGQPELYEWLEGITGQTLILILDGLEDPRNIGACIRTGAVAGADAVILPSHSGAGLTPAAMRVAEGGTHRLKIFEVGNWGQVLSKLRRAGVWLLGTGEEGDTNVFDFVDQNDKEHKFQSKDFGSLISDVDTQEYIYDSICKKLILKYDSGQLGIDDVTTDQEFADE